MLSRIALIFDEKLTTDDRTPVHLFGSLAVLPPKLEFWVQLTLLLSIQMVISAAFAVVVHKLIVSRQQAEPLRYLVGFGAVIPLALYVPFYLLVALDLESKTLAIGSGTGTRVRHWALANGCDTSVLGLKHHNRVPMPRPSQALIFVLIPTENEICLLL